MPPTHTVRRGTTSDSKPAWLISSGSGRPYMTAYLDSYPTFEALRDELKETHPLIRFVLCEDQQPESHA